MTALLVVAEPGDKGSTKSQTITLDGVVDGDVITLRSKSSFLFEGVTITGRLDGSVLTLSFPTRSGAMESNRFTRSTQERFNAMLSTWQQDLRAAYVRRRVIEEAAAARARRTDTAKKAAGSLRDTGAALESGERNLHEFAVFSTQIDACQNALSVFRETAARIEHELTDGTRCERLDSELSYLAGQLEYLRGARSYLEEHARHVEAAARDLRQQRAGFAQIVDTFTQAVANDPAGTFIKQRADIVAASTQLLKTTASECENARRVTTEARTSSDEIVAKGARAFETLKQRVRSRCTSQ